MEPPAPVDSDTLEEREHQLFILGRALRLMASTFEPATWQAFWETVVCGRAPSQVAAELGISVNAVYHAKSRVLRRLRRDLQSLID
jgi:RNA polymerase sigma-70 factor (ECF subfamily)